VRGHDDRGIVAVLDGRIARRSYGTTLLAGLPRDCPRTESLEEVAAFWAEIAAARPSAASAAPTP
jgi:Rad3-related DNA helicase